MQLSRQALLHGLFFLTTACAAGETASSGGNGGSGGSTWSSSGGSTSQGAGSSMGGAGTGGSSSGGAATGGAATGGSATGGAATGGAGTGGSATGGSGTGGAGTGGAATGGGSVGGGGTGGGGPLAYSHTIVIDGVNDFTADETFTTSSSPTYTGYVSWDASYVYLGMSGTDVGSNNGSFWVLAYFGVGLGGTMTGQAYGAQSPTLPFLAKYHLRWKADNTYTNARTFDGVNWVEAGWNFTGDVVQNGNFVELRVPRSDLANPNNVELTLGMINEPGVWTYAGVPATSYTDGADRDFAHHFAFDLTSDAVPNSYPAL